MLPRILFLFFVCCSVSAANGVLPAPQADRQANVATRLFLDACVANLGSEDKVKAWIRTSDLRPTEASFSKKVLMGRTGDVWAAPGRGGDFFVVVASPFHCAVWARRASARVTVENFRKLIGGVENPGVEVKLERDQTFPGQGGAYRQLAYLLKKQGSTAGWAMLATTSESADAEVQVRLTVSAARTG